MENNQFLDLLGLFKKHLELDRGFGIEFVPRAAPVKKAYLQTASEIHTVQEQNKNWGSSLSPEIPPEPAIPPDDIFEELRKEVASCRKCELCKTRTNAVFGEGDPATDLVFVGEGPGADEDRSGRPFVGKAGVQLTKIIQNGMNLSRSSVFIGNIVKCRPPGNRVPTLTEMAGCISYLKEQLRTIRPKVIVALGATACHGLLGERLAITKERGEFREWEGIKVMPTFHPAYLLRNYTPDTRRAVWEDMKAVVRYLQEQGSSLVEK